MAGVFKRITAKSITRHTAHKEYDLTFSLASNGISSASFDGLEAVLLVDSSPQTRFSTTYDGQGVIDYSGSTNLSENTQTQYGPGKLDFQNSIRSKFYKQSYIHGYKSALNPLPILNTFAIPHLMIGDGIKHGTVEISSASTHNYSDDGLGTVLRNEYPHNLSSSRDYLGYQLYTGNFYHYGPFQDGIVYNLSEQNAAPSQEIQGTWFNVQTIMPASDLNTTLSDFSHVGPAGQTRFRDSLIMSHSTHAETTAKHWYPGQPDAIIDSLYNNPQDSFDNTPPLPVGKFTLPITYVPSTPDTFDKGLTIWVLFRHMRSLANNNASGRKHILWTLGPCQDSNTATNRDSCLYLEYTDGGKIVLRSTGGKTGIDKSLTSSNVDVDDTENISVCITVTTAGVYRMDVKNYTDVATDSVTMSPGTEYLHNSSVDVTERQLVVGAGYYPTAHYDQYHSFTGAMIYDFRVWDKDIGTAAAQQLMNLEFSEAGNIFYEEGIISVNDRNTLNTEQLDECTLGFKNTVERDEYEYTCMVQDSEFNMSQNPTILQSGSTADMPVPKTFIGDGNWDPYITTIGLYNDVNELLAIGKLGRPIRKVETYDQTFIVKWDK